MPVAAGILVASFLGDVDQIQVSRLPPTQDLRE